MKLRIKGNSLRLRLTKTEVAQIKEGLTVQETASFGSASELHYSLEPTREINFLEARLENNQVRVLVPFEIALQWAGSNEVSLKNQTSTPTLLVEKDFFCLKPRTHEVEDESDMFANPREAHGTCR